MKVLAGDVGGTHTRLCIAECADHSCTVVRERRFDSRRFPALAPILHEFLADEPGALPETACLGIAGPVQPRDGCEYVKLTNLPWELDSTELARAVGLPRIRLINDFQAIGYGIEALGDSDLAVLQPGKPVAHGPRAVLGAGTGLGQGILVWVGDHYEAIATEGGHAGFAPTDELQLELARYLLTTEGHASCELVLSGHGLVRLYSFLRERGVAAESPALARAMRAGDAAAAITQAALAGKDALAAHTLELFVRIYGAQAGNLALTAGATGGVYVAGGIAPKILERLRAGAFIEAFRNKAGMSQYVAAIPVYVVLNEAVGLLGATLAASRL